MSDLSILAQRGWRASQGAIVLPTGGIPDEANRSSGARYYRYVGPYADEWPRRSYMDRLPFADLRSRRSTA